MNVCNCGYHCMRKYEDPGLIIHDATEYRNSVPVSFLFRAVTSAENFHGGVFIQWHMFVICIWCALFVTSQFDDIFMLSSEVC